MAQENWCVLSLEINFTQFVTKESFLDSLGKTVCLKLFSAVLDFSLSRKDDHGLIMANNSLVKMLGFSQEELKKINI